VDLERFATKCVDGQWKVGDLDWTGPPRPMSAEVETNVVQYFTDMAGIERLAGALFATQRDLVGDPTLKKIFSTFVADEERHARAAERLAAFYDVHHYRRYRTSPELKRFAPWFRGALKHLSPEVANAYVTGGELILDIALLRSIADYVDDDMADRVMELINRDESRHIAMDYYMMEHYASGAADDPAPKSRLESARAALAIAGLLFYAKPFITAVFLEPSRVADPAGRRIREAFKRMQLLSQKPELARRPFVNFMVTLRAAFNTPIVGRVFGQVISRLTALPPELLKDLYSESEARRAQRMTVEELGQDALEAKALHGARA
jgi:hypothetical protein